MAKYYFTQETLVRESVHQRNLRLSFFSISLSLSLFALSAEEVTSDRQVELTTHSSASLPCTDPCGELPRARCDAVAWVGLSFLASIIALRNSLRVPDFFFLPARRRSRPPACQASSLSPFPPPCRWKCQAIQPCVVGDGACSRGVVLGYADAGGRVHRYAVGGGGGQRRRRSSCLRCGLRRRGFTFCEEKRTLLSSV